MLQSSVDTDNIVGRKIDLCNVSNVDDFTSLVLQLAQEAEGGSISFTVDLGQLTSLSTDDLYQARETLIDAFWMVDHVDGVIIEAFKRPPKSYSSEPFLRCPKCGRATHPGVYRNDQIACRRCIRRKCSSISTHTHEPQKYGLKKCVRCGNLRTISEFNLDPKNCDGLESWCRQCRCSHSREWRLRNRDREILAKKTLAQRNMQRFDRHGPRMNGSKKCSQCQQRKPFTDFGIDRHRADGRCYVCKDCKRINNQEWRKNHRDKLSERKRISQLTGSDKQFENYIKTHSIDTQMQQLTQ